ncbi:hypothetical protein M0208_05290 [Sphingomonas sp. SUN019]|uniref:hypothetical protein n=1 Tax=Sphingomonas sp. SUN019 TaxID=2937788 RepID=UPI002164231D|nr:hypothetical protein [Sphingomonas sp. SUN019]UVO49962.1 hypothetical protein M0208_05290 [Sphingomonas sp. SUN019]
MAIGEAGTIGRAPLAAGTQWRTAARGFFASRCKAEGGGKKPRAAVAPGRFEAKLAPVRPSQSRGRVVAREEGQRHRCSIDATAGNGRFFHRRILPGATAS